MRLAKFACFNVRRVAHSTLAGIHGTILSYCPLALEGCFLIRLRSDRGE